MNANVVSGDRVGKLGKLTVGCSAAVFSEDRQKILLIKRADNRQWDVPGGYMEAGESVTEGCNREVLEETGIHIRVKKLIGVYTSPHVLLEYPDGNRWQIVILHFEAEAITGQLKTGGETLAIGYFSLSETEQMEMSNLERKRVRDAFASEEKAFICNDFLL